MQNFIFHNPTRIVFGEGTVSGIGRDAARFGRKALLVTGRGSIRKNGLYDQIVASLREAGLEVVDFPGVKSNPVLSHLREGVALAKREKVEVIVAAGGGSVLDEAKAIAAGALTDGDVWDFFINEAKVKAALPLVTVLTLAATGSEMNSGGVVTNEETKQKFNINSPHLFPKVSILDPTVTITVPADYTAYSAVDAICHLVEGYFTSSDPWTPLQDRLVEGLVKTIIESTERILADPADYQGRATMMWAATLALNGLAPAGIGPCGFPNHMIEHSLSALYDIPHGAGLGIVLPGWLSYIAAGKPEKIAQFGREVFGVPAADPKEAAREGVAALKGWFAKIGSPTTLADAGIDAAEIDRIAENATMLAHKWGMNDYPHEVIAEVLNCCR